MSWCAVTGGIDDVIGQDEEERRLREELTKTLQELSLRQAKLAMVDKELLGLRYKMERLRQGTRLRSSTSILMAQEAYRCSLEEKIGRGQLRRKECLADVERARERRQMVEKDLDEVVRARPEGFEDGK